MGESYVRQGLYGQKYLFENFGQYADTVFNIDSFGHSPMLPQILSKSHIKYYVFCRPEGRHINLKSPLFNWRSADGSTVLTYRDDSPYKPVSVAIERKSAFNIDCLAVYGVTDHGGAPTIRSIEEIKSTDNALFSTVKEYFENSVTDYTYDGELITGDFGVYSNNLGIKALNRLAEYAVLNAERASVIADENNNEALSKCWQDILFNQFHDILGGACIKDAYFDAENMYGRAIATAKEIMHYSLLKVTNRIGLPGRNPENVWNIVVWNLNPADFDGYIEAETQWVHEFPWYDKDIELEDEDANLYPCQIIREKSVIPAFRSRFLFKAKIPSLGYKAFKVVQTGEAVKAQTLNDIHSLHTERYVISISPQNGQITSVYDKQSGKKICDRLVYPAAFMDDGDTWCFNTDGFGAECEPFELKKLEVTECGVFRTTIKVTYTFRSSRLEMYYAIFNDEPYIEVTYRVNWNEKHLVLKLMTDVNTATHRVSVPYGSTQRCNTKDDVPMGEWLETDNLQFAANSIFSYNLTDKKLGLTVLRSAIYGDLRIKNIDLDVDYDIMSQGITEGKIRIIFDKKKPVEKTSVLFNNPPVVLCEANHNGTLAAQNSFCSLDSNSVIITVVKHAEDNSATVVRGVEYAGVPQKIKLTLKAETYDIDLSPYEIFTLKIKDGTAKK